MHPWIEPRPASQLAAGRDTGQTMSKENGEILARAYAAFQRGDLEAFVALHDPECEVLPVQARVEGRDPYRGHEGVRAFWNDLRSILEDWQPVPQEIRDHGDLMLVRMRLTGRAAHSGVTFDQTLWQAVEMRAGLLRWWGTYETEAEALEAAVARG